MTRGDADQVFKPLTQNPPELTMNIEDYTQEELNDLEIQTNSIVANLKYIEDHTVYQDEDLEALEQRLDSIVGALKYIEDHNGYRDEDLEELDERLGSIASNLKFIEDHQ
jgi:hypothetical protein